ncbi:MAG TPA: OmpH family outer membrane protein [Bacteroidales bacterium]|nr:OmpH family outer membrane protein [Bacteroidales bacterium]
MMNEEPIKEIQEEIPAENKETPKKCCDKKQCTLTTISILALVGVIVLFVLFFLPKKNTIENTPPKSIDNVTFAFVNTDTIWEKYDFVLDVQVDLANLEKIYQNQYATAVSNFQKEYNDYLKKGTAGLLSLNEQKATEEKLTKKQQGISEMEAQLSQKLMEAKTAKNQEVHDTIVHHIARYNKSKNYTFIFEKSFGGGLLFANEALDITNDILTGLNKEYEEINKAKKAEATKE